MSRDSKPKTENTIAYVDGFNLYFGLKSKGWKRYYWLNIHKLVSNLLTSRQNLVKVNYFTSRIRNNPEKQTRQNTYLDALLEKKSCNIIYGHYQQEKKKCFNCGNTYSVHSEKMTDVNIATEMLTDAHTNQFDTALLISADSDLTPVISKIKENYPRKRVVIGFPPKRNSTRLKQIADVAFTIGRKKLQDSQLADRIVTKDDFIILRPEKWR